MSAEELRGERELHPAMTIEFPDKPQRPLEAVLDLAPRLLGPLPPDLLPSMLPAAALTGPRAAALASQLFVTWLAGLPMEPVLQGAAGGAAPAAPPAGGGGAAAASSGASSWLSGLLGLWNRVLGPKAGAGRTLRRAAVAPVAAMSMRMQFGTGQRLGGLSKPGC